MKKLFPLALLLAALACHPAWATASEHAATAKPAPQKATGKVTAKPVAKASEKKQTKPKEKAVATKKAEQTDADVADMHATTYDCELGNNLTIYRKPDDDQQIALQWNKRMHRMQRMQTSTGADRFENTDQGLVWIGIPAKGMLLDSKKGRQLANECRNEEQKNLVKK